MVWLWHIELLIGLEKAVLFGGALLYSLTYSVNLFRTYLLIPLYLIRTGTEELLSCYQELINQTPKHLLPSLKSLESI
jgi:hypothetical protein